MLEMLKDIIRSDIIMTDIILITLIDQLPFIFVVTVEINVDT